ncbi:MAG: amidohydrolase [Bacteroidota bacterium]
MKFSFTHIFLFALIGLLALAGCKAPTIEEKAEVIISGGPIYTVNPENPEVEAVAIKNGKILFAGSKSVADSIYTDESTGYLNLEGKTLTPGLIESHGHFMGLGYSKLNVDLNGLTSYQELIDILGQVAKQTAPGEWIVGRGWHQSKWKDDKSGWFRGFPVHTALSEVTPNNPVYLKHASGHACLANAKAMEIAGVTASTEFPSDGEIIKDFNGKPTGIFNELAQGLISKHIPESTPERDRKALEMAIKESIEHGLTSFQDAGSGNSDIALFQEFLEEGKLKLNLWVMLHGRDTTLLNEWYEKGPTIDPEGRLTIRAIKLYADGALGSRGAWLLDPYTDRPNHVGMATMPMDFIYKITQGGMANGFQVCTHAIGDRANREVLDQYERVFNEFPQKSEDHRFRIEHAQHIHPEDIPRFGEMDVIASMQAIHMSSDRPWAINRLGKMRIEQGAYVWKKLFQSGAKIINGTDTPVEPVSPIASFYASVTRQTLAGEPIGGFEPEQKMTRFEALKSYTLDAAYGAFEEKIKGSIEVGKRADFTIFSQDILQVPDSILLQTEIEMTIVGGEMVYKR